LEPARGQGSPDDRSSARSVTPVAQSIQESESGSLPDPDFVFLPIQQHCEKPLRRKHFLHFLCSDFSQ